MLNKDLQMAQLFFKCALLGMFLLAEAVDIARISMYIWLTVSGYLTFGFQNGVKLNLKVNTNEYLRWHINNTGLHPQ